ncbi:MAG: SDR family NAD(P)-dependent oxidoreductase [Candidatus Heimdallarchaeota archaeon]
MKELKDKNCFITGAASGIGRSFALNLAKEGMNLYISDINMENLEKVKNEVELLGAKVYTGKCDVSKCEDLKAIAKDFYSKLGDVDLLINNAGIAIGGDILEVNLEDWKKVLDVNLWSIIYSLNVFLPQMMERKSGHIVNVASGAGIFGSAEPLPYITSKFAVVGLSEALFGQLNSFGISVSVIVPTYIKTNIFSTAQVKFSKKLEEAIGKEKLEQIYKELLKKMASKAILPDRAVQKYIKGIKNNQLYIYDSKGILTLLGLKGNQQHYEKFLIDYNQNFINVKKEHFGKSGVNLDDYR